MDYHILQLAMYRLQLLLKFIYNALLLLLLGAQLFFKSFIKLCYSLRRAQQVVL